MTIAGDLSYSQASGIVFKRIRDYLYAGGKNSFSQKRIREEFANGIPRPFAEAIIEHLRDHGFITRGTPHKITHDGLLFLDKQAGFGASEGTWFSQDSKVGISTASVIEARKLIISCMDIISNSRFSQEEKSQLRGLLKICEDVLDLPTPKTSLIKTVLSWLKEVKEISDLVIKISEFFN